jgi:SET domain-containing protein
MSDEIQPEPNSAQWLVFRSSSIHGTGAFASSTIPTGVRVIEYVGERITKAESVRRCELRNEYIFSLDEETDIDGNVPWNLARLINHSCSPNCESQYLEGKIWIISLREIAPGEEATFNYGYDLEDFEDHPCRCGSPDCAGFIVAEEFFDEVQRRLNAAKWSAAG